MIIDPNNLNQNVRAAQETQQKLFNRISSGLKINSAADDAAGLQIANRLSALSNGLNQSIRNANDGISLAEVADAALGNVTEASFRIEELSIQVGNGALSASDRQAIQQEINQLQGQISDTFNNTQFGGIDVFSGTATTIQVGASANSTIEINAGGAAAFETIRNIDVTSASGAQQALSDIQAFRETIDTQRSNLGATQNRLASAIEGLANSDENIQAALSRIQDTDFAQSLSELTSASIQEQAGIAIQSQANANRGQILALLNTR